MAQNTASSPSITEHQYPGLGLPLRKFDWRGYHYYPSGAHASCYGNESELVSVRELAMMDVMEKLTDKQNWFQKVFDEDIVAKWRKEALTVPDGYYWDLSNNAKRQWWPNDDEPPVFRDGSYNFECELENIMDKATFQSCIQELRGKAKYFEQTGIIPTMDASASIAKSDTIVSADLHKNLRNAFDKLKSDHATSPDWHPNSNDMVQDLVHPSMYPLVYGRSRGFQAEHVGVTDAITHWAGKGNVVPKTEYGSTGSAFRFGDGIPPHFWSDTYQWLPANVAFGEDGKVKFTSYINNLHPNKYPDIYRTIEKLIDTSIPMWDQCMRMAVGYHKHEGAGRLETRLVKTQNASDYEKENWIPDSIEACADVDVDMEEFEEEYGLEEGESADMSEEMEEQLLEHKWKKIRKPRIPEIPFKDVDYAPKPGQRLAERFAASGLQIIVKMASIELTPEKPQFPVGGWHVEGQMNESICATALYYLDSDNITDSSLSFRMQTPDEIDLKPEFNVGQDSYHWLEQIYGTVLGCGSAPRLQNYGSVQTRQGRLLAFPNVFQHRVSPFELIDPTKPGHRRFIALWLVDPTKRIISTANIPPQQITWYTEALLGPDDSPVRKEALEKMPADLVKLLAEHGAPGLTDERECKLPEELLEFVRSYLDEGGRPLPMTAEEANEHRVSLMRERSVFVKKSENEWKSQTYNFCEH